MTPRVSTARPSPRASVAPVSAHSAAIASVVLPAPFEPDKATPSSPRAATLLVCNGALDPCNSTSPRSARG
eukprot:scaffold7310_cov116-Isochrysis_galbana.AAC.2